MSSHSSEDDDTIDHYKISERSKRFAFIITDFTDADPTKERMEKDVIIVKKLLENLHFNDKNVVEFHNLANNVLSKNISDSLTFGQEHNDGYVMIFILTYKQNGDSFRADSGWYDSELIRQCFVVNNLKEWADSPKLIFYQTPMKEASDSKTGDGDTTTKGKREIPIDANIFQSFSNDGNEDSYGDDNGSFYIQALSEVINKHVADKTLKDIDLMHIMYEVHDKIDRAVKNLGSQTPRFKTTFVKKFNFPE